MLFRFVQRITKSKQGACVRGVLFPKRQLIKLACRCHVCVHGGEQVGRAVNVNNSSHLSMHWYTQVCGPRGVRAREEPTGALAAVAEQSRLSLTRIKVENPASQQQTLTKTVSFFAPPSYHHERHHDHFIVALTPPPLCLPPCSSGVSGQVSSTQTNRWT